MILNAIIVILIVVLNEGGNMYKLVFQIESRESELRRVSIDLDKKHFKIFEDINSNFIKKDHDSIEITDSFFSKASIVEDEIRYVILTEDCDEDVNKNDKMIVLLIESPHKSEYEIENGKLKPINPAQGSSPGSAGGGIERYLEIVLNKSAIPDGTYELVIVNPIQYQASLVSIHDKALKNSVKELRDKVWENLWNEEIIRNDFKNRLKSYNPIRIINACTAKLSGYVNEELINLNYKDITYVTTHPAVTWNVNQKDIEVEKL